MIKRNNSVNGKHKTRIAAGAALLAVSMLFVSCPREVGLGAAVDTQKPVVTITTPDVDAVVKDVITLSGRATDETALDSVTVSFQSTEANYSKSYTANLDKASGTWSLTVDTKDATNGLPDFKYEATVTAKDKSGKTSTAARSFQLDNRGPTILVTKPSTFGPGESIQYYKQVEIRGECADASSVKSVKVGLYKSDGTFIAEKTADGTDTWSALFYLSDLQNASIGQLERVYFYVSAVDKADNVSTSFYHKQDLYALLVPYKEANPDDELYFPTTMQLGSLDTNTDTSSKLVVNGVKADNTPISNPPVITKTDLTAQQHEGIASGVPSAETDTYPYFYFTSTGSASIEWNSWSDSEKSVSQTSPILASIQPPTDGSSVLLSSLKVQFVYNGVLLKTLTVREEGATSATNYFTAQRMGEAVNLSIPTQENGLNAAKYDIYLSGKTNSNTVIGYEFDNEAGLYLENGSKVTGVTITADTVQINNTFFPVAIANAGQIFPVPGSTGYSTPEEKANVSVWYVRKGTNLSGDFKLPIDVSGLGDTTGIYIKVGTLDEERVNGATNLNPEFNTEYTVAYADLNEGSPTGILLKAQNASKQVYIQRDEDGPDLKITTPKAIFTDSDMTAGKIRITGTALDMGAGLESVSYALLEGDGSWPSTLTWIPCTVPANSSGWTADIAKGSQGKKTIKIKAVDKLGNVTITENAGVGDDSVLHDIVVFYDNDAPGITEITLEGDRKHADFTLTGKVWDSDAIDEITVTAQGKIWSNKTGTGIIQAVTINPSINSKKNSESEVSDNNWSLNFEVGSSNSTKPTFVADGTILFTITVKDVAGNSNSTQKSITLDTVAPTIMKSTGDGFALSLVKHDESPFVQLKIHASDENGNNPSGLEGVYYQLTETSENTAPNMNAESDWTAMAQGTGGIWTANVDFSGITADTAKKAWFMAKDRVGNKTLCTSTAETTIDMVKPVLSLVPQSSSIAIPTFTDAESDVNLYVRVTDTNSTAPVVRVNKPDGTLAMTIPSANITAPTDRSAADYQEYKVVIPFNTELSSFPVDGDYTIIINEIDENGRTATQITHTILRDKTSPVINLTNYTSSSWIDIGTIALSGNVIEANLSRLEAWYEYTDLDGNTSDLTTEIITDAVGSADLQGRRSFTWRQYELDEGSYVAHIKATDASNRVTTKESGDIVVDMTAPVSTLLQNQVGQLYDTTGTALTSATLTSGTTYLANTEFTLKGVITERNLHTAKLTVKKDGVTLVNAADLTTPVSGRNTWTATDAQKGPYTWTFKQTIAATNGDGTYVYTLELADKSNNRATYTLTVKVDTTAPTLSITTPGENQSSSVATMTIRGTAEDTGAGVKKVHYAYVDANGTEKGSGDADINGNTWTKALDFTSVGEGTFTLKVTATDNLGNQCTEATVPFSYDKADPELVETGIGNDSTITNTDFTLKGKAWDSNLIKEITITTTVGNSEKTWSNLSGTGKTQVETLISAADITAGKKATAAEVASDNWQITFMTGSANKNDPNYIADGTNSFTIVITDVAGKTRSYNRTVTVDSTKPSITIGTNDGFPQIDVSGTSKRMVLKDVSPYSTLKVQVTDPVPTEDGGTSATGLAGVYYKITDSTIETAPAFGTDAEIATWTAMAQGSSNGWTANVDFSDFTTDTEKRAWIAAKDRAGNKYVFTTEDAKLIISIDQRKPVLEIRSGATFTSQSTDLELTVRVTDTNPVVVAPMLNVSVYKPNANGSAMGNAANPPSTQKVSITSYTTTLITPLQTTEDPPYAEYKVKIPFNTNSTKFSGDGEYTVLINAVDENGRAADQIAHIVLQDTSAPNVTLTSYTDPLTTNMTTIIVNGSVSDANLVSVTAWLNNDSAHAENITNAVDANGDFSWTKYGLSEGEYTVHVKATDAANLSTIANSAQIIVDTTAPVSTLLQATQKLYTTSGTAVSGTTLTNNTTYLAKETFTLKGVVTELHIKSAKLKVSKDGATPVEKNLYSRQANGSRINPTTGCTWDITNQTWTYAETVNATSHANDGVYEYTLELEDDAGNQKSYTITVKVDTTAPTVSVITPGDNESFVITNPNFKGTASDEGAGIKKVYYTFGTDPADPTTSSATATLSGGSWSKAMDFSSAGEGVFKLKVMAEDMLGNKSAVQTIPYSYDLHDPELTETGVGSGGLTTKDNFTFSGTAWDSNKISEITIAGQGKTWSNLSGTGKTQVASIITAAGITAGQATKADGTSNVTADNWSITFKVGSNNSEETTYLTDGTTTFTITIIDIAGKSRSYTRTVTVDTTAPTLSLETNDGFEKELVEQDISPYNKLTVHASDSGTGLESVFYQITQSAESVPSFTADTGWTAMTMGTGGAWTSTADFSSITADGTQYVWFAAKDRVGNRAVLNTFDDTYVDLHKPVLSRTSGDNFTSATADLELVIRVADTNPTAPTVSVVKPKADGTAGGTELNQAQAFVTVTTETTAATYTDYTVKIPFLEKASTYNIDGIYTLKINAKDEQNRTADQFTWTILQDKTAPVVELTSYTVPTFTSNRTLTVTGKVKDDNLSSVFAWLNSDEAGGEDITNLLGAPEPDTSSPDYKKQSFEWKRYELEEGTYYVHIKATDAATLTNTAVSGTSASITIDFTDPVSTLLYEGAATGDKLYDNNGTIVTTIENGGSYLAKTGFKLKGVITEENFKEAQLAIKKDNVAQTPVTITSAGAWEYTQAAVDANYEYTLTVKDKANNSLKMTVTVKVDTTAPTLVITKPASSEKIETATYKFAGTVSDLGAGVSTVSYVLKNGGVQKASGNATITGASWAVNGTNNAGVTLGDEGTLTIEVTATDKLGQSTTETTTFYYDEAAPDIDETNIGVSTLITGSEFTLSGTASDTNALKGVNAQGVAVGAINISKGTGVNKVDYGDVNVAAPVAPATAGVWTKTFTPGTGEGQLADGTYTFSIKATDVSGRETIIQRTVVVDTVAPTISKVTGKSSFIIDTPTNTWYNKGSIAISASVADDRAGGIASVEYAVISNPTSVPTATTWQGNTIEWKSMSKGSSSYNANAEVEDGTNYIVIRATDAAGNVAYTTQETAKVDTLEPSLVGAYEEQACTTGIMTQVTNAADPMTIYIKTEDTDAIDDTKEGSTVTKVLAKIGSKSFTSGYIEADKVATNVYELTLSETALAAARGSDDGQKTVYVQITDKAGNKSSATSLFTLQYDTVGPDIEFVSPATDSTASTTTVNKTITITGKANDLQGLYGVSLFYLFNDTDTDNKVQIGDEKTGRDAANWSFELDTMSLLDHKLAANEDAELTLIAEATDTAGNVSSESITISIDQMLDIPEITINNFALTGMTSSTPVWLKGNNVIFGTIIDDDGISSLQMSTNGGTNWTNIPVSGGSFQVTLPLDETYTVLFKATDTAGGVFTSGSTSDLTSLKLKDNSSPAVTSADGKLYITVDTETPQIQAPKYALDGTSTTAADWTTTLLVDTTFGGTADTEFTIKQYAYDENGIKKVEVIIDSGTPVAATRQASDTYTDPITQEVYTAYTYTVDVSTLDTNLGHTLKILVTDNADMTNDTTTTFKVDNDAPTVTLGSHANEDRVKGTFFVSGTTQDAPLYGPAATMLYKVTLSQATPTGTGAWTTLPTTSETYAAHEVEGNLASWRIYFDDDLNAQDGYTHDRALKKILVQLRSDLEIATSGSHVGAVVWKNAGTGHAAGDLFTPITTMYIHLKSTDAYGNETDFVRSLSLDPQGDIPTISVAYPSVSAYGWKNGSNKVFTEDKLPEVGDDVYTDIADMSTPAGIITAVDRAAKTITYNSTTYTSYGGETVQGGIVRVQGTADGQNAITGIFMQIDPNYNRATGFTWDPTGNALMPNGAKLSTRYTITDIGTTGMKGIKVGDSVSWSASLNRNSEFNGSSGAKSYIGIRLYAVDEKNNVSPLNVADDIIVTIDSDTPQVGSSEELYLYQYSNNTAGTGTVTASVKYEDDMWLKGEWWIKGSVEDSNGIASVEVQKQQENGTFADHTFTKTAQSWASAGSSGFIVKFKIGSATADSYGKLVYQIYALDNDSNAKSVTKQISINYDNAAPVLAGPTHEDYNINHEVVQNNGFYTLGSSITETGSSTASQSGFQRVALYFVRPGASKGKGTLYDTYFLKSTQANPTANELKIDVNATSGAKNSGSDVSYSDGLYWKSQEVTRNPENLSALTLTTADPNVHAGGLVRIGGTMYVISSVSGTSVTIKGSPAIANTTTNKENADFAMALVIDHALTEGNGTAANLVNGYYTDVVNDDGDHIVEKVATQGYTTFWEANICSRNIPDGAIEIHYVAFDKAGNYASGVVACSPSSSYRGLETVSSLTYDYDADNLARVANNAPRLAGVVYGTDDNGDGTVADSEMHAEYFAMSVSDAGVKEGYSTTSLRTSYLLGTKNAVSVLKIKGATKIMPEIVGGNGTLGFSYTVTAKDATSPYYSKGYQALSATGSDYSASGAASEIKDIAINLSVADLLAKDDLEEPLVDGEKQTFSFTIWDSTAGMTAGTNSQKATLEMVVDLELKDSVAPNTYIWPFYWKSKTDNSVYQKVENGKSTLQGHIELGSDIGTLSTSVSGINDNDDKVSGSIVIEGTAQDNVLLKDIYMMLYTGTNTSAFNFSGATKTTSGTLNNFYKVAHYENGTWTSYGTDYDGKGWKFSIVSGSETFTQEEGHTVTWQLVLNTEKITNVAAADVKLVVRAQDQGKPALSGGNITYTQNTSATASTTKTSGETTATQTNYNKFDVVPYITGVSTRLSSLKKNNPTIYNRTSKGNYPVGAGEVVVFAGFNLTGAKYGNTTLGTLSTAETTALLAYYKNIGTSWGKLTIGTTQTSGAIQLTNNSIPTLNNLNNNNSKGSAVDENGDAVVLSIANYDSYAYNRQPNGDNNQYLTDDVYFDVWSINTAAAQARDGGVIEEPVMEINPSTGAIGLAFASGADSFCMPGTINNNSYSYTWWSTNYANFSNVALAYDTAGNAWSIAVGLDTNSGDGGYGGRMALMGSLWGRGGNYNQTHDNFAASNKMRLESIGIPQSAYVSGTRRGDYLLDTKRFKSTTLAVTTHGTTRGFYLAYYDRLTGQIRFRSGSTNATAKTDLSYFNRSGNGSRNSPYVYEGYYFGQFVDNWGISNGGQTAGYVGEAAGNGDYGQHRCFEPEQAAYSLIAGAESNVNSDSSTTGFVAGSYVALDVIPGTGNTDAAALANDTVIVTFYDGSDLWYVSRQGGVGSDNNVLKTGDNGNWKKPIQVFEGIGQNCTIKAGPDGSVHIACYDQTEGCLKYAYMSSATGTSFKTATIDGYGIAGSNISLDVVKETVGTGTNATTVYIPYISYYAPSIQKVKVAYLTDYSALSSSTAGALDGCDDNDSYTGVWECAIIPTASSVNDDNTNIGFYKDTDGSALAIKSNLTASAGKENGNCNGNGTTNPAIAYGTTANATGYIEVVQKQ